MNWQTNSGRMASKLLPCMVASLRSFTFSFGVCGKFLRNEELPEESEKRDGSISLSLSLSRFM